ncbi:beta-galactosidase GalB [Brachybacterium sp. J144]|uniref:beta-galactosidase GalB n=1 Tax=Brachybacterium sp. J144 TaxID=3116487 RepID=UPI002E76C9C0|nr:beta-galactosidase GalB [Brachybacterium sp. J144]MEE1650214.1 beta-galactosidase GalB [Brachybacterium sp. J144]
MTPSPRERRRLDAGWRFRRIPASEVDRALDYIPWPDLGEAEDGKDADARPEDVRHDVAEAGLRRWILPCRDEFVGDPAASTPRPAEKPLVRPDAAQPEHDDSSWQQVVVPHDWAIAGPFLVEGPHGGMGRLESWGVGWYRRELDIPAEDAGRRLHLEIDGAMSYATVWVNGELVGGWPYGYNSWRLDLTDHLVPGGRNVLAIRLDNPPRSARWYPGGGLFRDVHLVRTAPLAVAHWGTRVTTPHVAADRAQVDVEVTLDNAASAGATALVRTEILPLDPEGPREDAPVVRAEDLALEVPAGARAVGVVSAELANPALWGPPPTQHPHRYLARTTVLVDGEVVDRVETPFGVRTVRFDPDEGLLVNGERIPIQGVNNHHDLGALGAAFHLRAARRQLEILQEMGANALRTAHNPPAPELLDLADELGVMVLDELFDSWYARKTDLDFHLIFEDWHEADLRAMIRRDRNHPSVILWGVGNEVGEQYTEEDGAEIARRLVAIAHDEDPTRLATSAMNYAKPHMPLPGTLDVIGINYQGEGIRQEPEFEGTDRIRTPPQYPLFRERHPRTPILGTETASALSSRGVYLFPVTPSRSAPARDGSGADSTRCQVSAYELHAVDFGSTAEKVFATLAEHPYVAGEFVWTGFDYLGEPTPYYSARSSYTGIVDLAGFPKDRFWLYRSQWRPEVPTAHLLPHWTWPGREGEVTPVHLFTSGDEAELFVNGTSHGRRRKEPGTSRMRWDEVVYEPGEISVLVTRDGRPWAEDSRRTAGPARALVLEADRSAIEGDGRDLSFVTVRVVDAQGIEVPTADHAITVEVTGDAELAATDNGDPTDLVAFPSPMRRAFSGLALAIVRGTGRGGTARVRASADGLHGAELEIRTRL